MQYINPFELLSIPNEKLEDIDTLIVKRAKRKLFADIELSGTDSILFNKIELTKSDCLRIIDELDDKDKNDFHLFINQNKDLCNFLSRGELGLFYRFKVESIYKLPEFIDFVSPYFAYQYDKQLTRYYKDGNYEVVKLILNTTPIVNRVGMELSYKGVYLFLKEQENEIIGINNDIENKVSPYFINDFEGIADVIKNKAKIQVLNVLPNNFQNIRNQIAKAINITAIKIHNNYEKYKPSFELMTIAYNISTDGLIKQNNLENYYIIKRHYDDELKAEKEKKNVQQNLKKIESYKPIIEALNKILYDIEHKQSTYISNDFSELCEWIFSKIGLGELNAQPNTFNIIRDKIAIQIKHLSITIWNDFEKIEPAFKLIDFAAKIEVSEETREKIFTAYYTLSGIKEKQSEYVESIPPISSIGPEIFKSRFLSFRNLIKNNLGIFIIIVIIVVAIIASNSSTPKTESMSPTSTKSQLTNYNSSATNNKPSDPPTGEIKFNKTITNKPIIVDSSIFAPSKAKVLKHNKAKTHNEKTKLSNSQNTGEVKF